MVFGHNRDGAALERLSRKHGSIGVLPLQRHKDVSRLRLSGFGRSCFDVVNRLHGCKAANEHRCGKERAVEDPQADQAVGDVGRQFVRSGARDGSPDCQPAGISGSEETSSGFGTPPPKRSSAISGVIGALTEPQVTGIGIIPDY